MSGSTYEMVERAEVRPSPDTAWASVEFFVGRTLGSPLPFVLPLVPSVVLVILSEAWAQWPLNRVGAL